MNKEICDHIVSHVRAQYPSLMVEVSAPASTDGNYHVDIICGVANGQMLAIRIMAGEVALTKLPSDYIDDADEYFTSMHLATNRILEILKA